MSFEWDDTKNESNLNKHGIAFEEAVLIFKNPVLTTPDSRYDYGEKREISIGGLSSEVVIVVVHN